MPNYNSSYTGQQHDVIIAKYLSIINDGDFASKNWCNTNLLGKTENATTATTASYLSAPAVDGFYTDEHGNFTHNRSTTTDYFHLNKNDGTSIFSIYWETGTVNLGGILNLKAEQYNGNYGLNCNNSDIVGINSLRTADNAEAYGEGLMFYRGSSSWDCMAASGGNFHFKSGTDGTPTLSSGNSNANLYAGCYGASVAATLSAGLPTPRETARAFLCGNGLFISGPYTSNDCGWIRTTSTSEANFQLEIATGDDGGAGEEILCRQYNTSNAIANRMKLLDTGGNTLVQSLYIIRATGASMGNGTPNPRIVFGEGSINDSSLGCTYSQGVALAYTDYDSYRASKGLKVLDFDGNDGGNVWFEAQGQMYSKGFNNTSSRTVKHNINNLDNMGDILDQLQPVTFEYNDIPGQLRYGLIFEDTINILPTICEDSGESKTINYVDLVPILLKEIQSLRKRIKQLENK